MSKLTTELRLDAERPESFPLREKILDLCSDHERLELEFLEALEREAKTKVERDDFESEWATESEERLRLEGLLRAWTDHPYDDSEATKELWREAVTIAKERT